jgi:DNA (cytosine-5)-methyltransferase 1
MDFIDLFAGLGGFHYAAESLGHRCVFACEKDKVLRELYVVNHSVSPAIVHGDIKESKSEVPPHDLLLAGFPCQSFSKSGKQLGFRDEGRGDLLFDILDILSSHRPRYFVFENVGNFPRHNGGRTWNAILYELIELGYSVRYTRPNKANGSGLLSPHKFGFPQNRDRFFAIGSLNGLPRDHESFPLPNHKLPNLNDFINKGSDAIEDAAKLSDSEINCIEDWNKLIASLPNQHFDLSGGFPLWLDEYQQQYPFLTETPYSQMIRMGLSDDLIEAKMKGLPPYAREQVYCFPKWKTKFILQNREWIDTYSNHIPKSVIQSILARPHSHRKLEWNYKQSKSHSIWDCVFQFRPSGIRVSNPNYIPSVVALCNTQTPIYGPVRRRLLQSEIKRIFGFPDNMQLPMAESVASRALGNAVHVNLATMIIEKLTSYSPLMKVQPDYNEMFLPLAI